LIATFRIVRGLIAPTSPPTAPLAHRLVASYSGSEGPR
jgi:hypothetical protein